MISLDHFALTNAGKVRANNEDALLSGDGRDPRLFAVADGVGGFEAGEVASSLAIEALKEIESWDSLHSAIQEANRRVYSTARDNEKLSGMGTTVVAVRLVETGDSLEAEISHVGDSRVYLLRDGDLEPLTEDHSLVAELVRSGSLTRAQASEHPQKNLITRALGAEEEVEVDSGRHQLQYGDRLVLCSDGLPDMVPESRISELASRDEASNAEESARILISAALSAGGTDNVTVVVVDVNQSSRSEVDAARVPATPARDATHRKRQIKRSPPPDAKPASEDPEEPHESGGGPSGRQRVRKKGGRKGDADPPNNPQPGRDSNQRRRKRDGNYTRLRQGGSLIPGVWDGAVAEEPEEPRELTPEEIVEQMRVRSVPDVRETREDPKRRRRRKRVAQSQKVVSALIRGFAALALVGLLLLPPYLWWSTRYFMAYDGGKIVIYQGVPYDFFGNELNRLDQRTGVKRSDIAEPYRGQIRDNKLYTEDRLQTVLKDLQKG